MPPEKYLSRHQLKDLRALRMVRMYLEGKQITEIAKTFKVSTDTVQRNFERAAEQGLVQKITTHEETLIEELVPTALSIYRDKLINERDPYVAKDVIDKMVKIGDRLQNKQQHQQRLGLDAYIAAKKGRIDETANAQVIDQSHIDATSEVVELEPLPEKIVGEDSE